MNIKDYLMFLMSNYPGQGQSVTDDKVSPLSYVSGDVNADNLLQPGETWIFTGTATLSATATNTATATGSANNITATDVAFATVIVTPPVIDPPPPVIDPPPPVIDPPPPVIDPPPPVIDPPPPVIDPPPPVVDPPPPVIDPPPPAVVPPTVTGGELPQTATRLYELFLIGVALILVGAVGWRIRRRFE